MNKLQISCLIEFKSILPSYALSILVIGQYIGYILTLVIPLLKYEYNNQTWSPYSDQRETGIIYASISGYFLLLLIISLLRAAFTSAGSIPNGWNDMIFDKALQVYEMYTFRNDHVGLFKTNMMTMDLLFELMEKDENLKEYMKQKGFRVCRTCRKFKPERTHHCRQCGACVLKMDHHCNWLVNCIGFYNYKYFFIGLMYSVLCSMFITVTYSECFFNVISQKGQSIGMILGISFIWVMNLSIMIIIGSFWFFHLNQLIGKGKTTIEFCESTTRTHYNLGFWTNLKFVLGKNPLFWFLPFGANTDGHGLKYEQNL